MCFPHRPKNQIRFENQCVEWDLMQTWPGGGSTKKRKNSDLTSLFLGDTIQLPEEFLLSRYLPFPRCDHGNDSGGRISEILNNPLPLSSYSSSSRREKKSQGRRRSFRVDHHRIIVGAASSIVAIIIIIIIITIRGEPQAPNDAPAQRRYRHRAVMTGVGGTARVVPLQPYVIRRHDEYDVVVPRQRRRRLLLLPPPVRSRLFTLIVRR
jgi:hypothetical protein